MQFVILDDQTHVELILFKFSNIFYTLFYVKLDGWIVMSYNDLLCYDQRRPAND